MMVRCVWWSGLAWCPGLVLVLALPVPDRERLPLRLIARLLDRFVGLVLSVPAAAAAAESARLLG